jgi:hypothetical protein
MGAVHPVQGGAEIHVMNDVRQSRRLGTIGSVVGLLALLASVLTQWLPAVFPPEPVDQLVEEPGPKLRDHLTFPIFRTKRLETRPREASEQRTAGYAWNQGLSTAAVALGLLAIALAVFSIILREEKLLAGVAAALGIAAIAVQVYWILIGVVILMVIVNALFS